MKDLIKKILREEISKKYTKSSSNAESVIVRHMEKLISNTTSVIPPPEENYGNYSQEWCKGDKIVMEARYYFGSEDDEVEDEKFFAGDLYIHKGEVEFLSKMLQIRKSYILNVITEWYDEKYTTKFGQETGHPEFEIDETHEMEDWRKCYQMIDVDNLSRDEMIHYLDKETLGRRKELEGLSDDELKLKYRSIFNARNR
jgi:hypothetical protein